MSRAEKWLAQFIALTLGGMAGITAIRWITDAPITTETMLPRLALVALVAAVGATWFVLNDGWK